MRLPRRLSWLQFVAALIGLGMFVAGGVALFTIDNSAGSLFLVALGVTLILVALLGERVQLESFEILGAKLRVREVIASRLELAQLARPGEDDRARAEVYEQALTVQKLVGLHDLYEHIRGTERASNQRTAALDQLAMRMRTAGTRCSIRSPRGVDLVSQRHRRAASNRSKPDARARGVGQQELTAAGHALLAGRRARFPHCPSSAAAACALREPCLIREVLEAGATPLKPAKKSLWATASSAKLPESGGTAHLKRDYSSPRRRTRDTFSGVADHTRKYRS